MSEMWMSEMSIQAPKEVDDCWNQIGTWAAQSQRCPRLPTVGHCGNCDVYRSAGRELLKREAPAGYLAEWREFLARPVLRSSATAAFYLYLNAGERIVGIQTRTLEQVANASVIRRLPHNRSRVLQGVANVRGEVLPCISLNALLAEGAALTSSVAEPAYKKMVVATFGAHRWILPAVDVLGLHRHEQSDFVTVDKHASPILLGSIGWQGKTVDVLDVAAVSESLSALRL